MLTPPSSWRMPPFLAAALALLPALFLWLDPSAAREASWALAAVGAMSLLGGVGEHLERRRGPGRSEAAIRALIGSGMGDAPMVGSDLQLIWSDRLTSGAVNLVMRFPGAEIGTSFDRVECERLAAWLAERLRDVSAPPATSNSAGAALSQESDIPPDSQHEARLFVAVTYDGDTATILAHAGDASAVVDGVKTVFPDELGLDVDRIPREPGLHAWEGRVIKSPYDEKGDAVEWLGTWRRATPEEARRYAAGEPVWGSQ